MTTDNRVLSDLQRALNDGDLDVPTIFYSYVELDENGAGQPTYRVVMVSVDRVVPVWASETQPSAMCVICHLTLPPSDAHGGLCCRHKYDAQPLCPSCSVTDAERYKLFEQGAEIAQRLDWERDQLECLAADAFGGQG